MTELLPKPPRRMKQPTKDTLRRQLADKTEELERLRDINTRLTRRWWHRFTRKRA